VDHQLIAQAGTAASGIDNITLIKCAALLSAGIGAIGVGVPGIGIGIAASRALEGMARQPEMQGKLLVNGIIFAALMEALGLFAFLVALQLVGIGNANH
jgi:F-type H+-transporting ATPase subunit c